MPMFDGKQGPIESEKLASRRLMSAKYCICGPLNLHLLAGH